MARSETEERNNAMEILLESESQLKISWNFNYCHIKDREYVSGPRGWHGPGVNHEQALANEKEWKALSAEDKIAREDTFAFHIEGCGNIGFDVIQKQLFTLFENDLTAYIRIVEPYYRTVKVVKDEFVQQLTKATQIYNCDLDRYNKLVHKFVRSLKGYDLYDGTDVSEFDFSAPQLKKSKEWFREEQEILSVKGFIFVFRRDSPTFALFEKHGWIKKYASWN